MGGANKDTLKKGRGLMGFSPPTYFVYVFVVLPLYNCPE